MRNSYFFLVFAIFAWFMVVHLLDQTCIFMTCLLSYHWFQVRLGWHDAGTYDKNITEWPKCGGANGSLRFGVELVHAANKGLLKALFLVIPIKSKYAGVTYADIFQLASATAIEEAGGPKIPMIYGRADVADGEECPPEGRLPGQ
jgi:L-ascorbate peroxidase